MKNLLLSKLPLVILFITITQLSFSQNVGINATGASAAASAMLDITSTTKGLLIPRMTSAQRAAIASPATGLLVYDTNFNRFYYYNGATWMLVLNNNDNDKWSLTGNSAVATDFIGTLNAIDFVTKTNNTERMRVTSTGDVGIGTNLPSATLEVFGNAAGGLGVLAIKRSDLGGSYSHALIGGNGDWFIRPSLAAGKVVIADAGGNVGVGANSPQAKLDVIGNNSLDNGALAIWRSDLGGSYSHALIGANGDWYIRPSLAAGKVVIADGGGNVGIGTASPSAMLHVYSSSPANNTNVFRFGDVAGSAYLTAGGSYVALSTFDGTARLTVLNSGGSVGNVGIGTLTPGAKLEVAGQVKITGGTPGAGKVLTSDATGLASWTTPATITNDWSLAGNTVTASDFIGTTNFLPLNFKVNNTSAGIIEPGGATFFGHQAGIVNTAGASVGFGLQALFSNTTGQSNSAIGFHSLYINTTGNANTAIGRDALFANNGDNNTAIGVGSLFTNGGGNSNVGIGVNAGSNNTSGSFNTFMGSFSDASVSTFSNSAAIGYSATVNASNKVQIGNASITSVQLGTASSVTLETGSVKITGGTPGLGKVLISDATGLATWATPGTATGGWGILGNATTVAGTNFIGTTDAIDFVTRTNNTERMRVKSGGAVNIWSGGNYAVPNNFMAGGSLTLGNTTTNFGGGNVWTANTAGLLMECLDNTEIAIHDNATRVASIAYYEGAANRINIGRDMGWGTISTIALNGDVGINTTTPANKLQVNSATNTSMVQTSNSTSGATATDGAVFGLFNNSAYLYNRENAEIFFGTNNTRRMTLTAGGNLGVGTALTNPQVPLAVGGIGANIYATDAWVENNMHVQGNEGLVAGGRGRLRVGTAWNFAGLYAEVSSTGTTNDLVLGASSAWVRIGPNGGGQNLNIPTGQLLLGQDNAVKPGTSTWIISSDERLKTIHGSYNKGLAEILKLNTITYKYKNVGEKKFDEKVLQTTQIGFSAQEVQKIFPEAVGVGEDGYLNLNMHAILVAYTNAIKELDAKNKEQEQINNDLKLRLEKLEALIKESK